jgi:hypothetical protein
VRDIFIAYFSDKLRDTLYTYRTKRTITNTLNKEMPDAGEEKDKILTLHIDHMKNIYAHFGCGDFEAEGALHPTLKSINNRNTTALRREMNFYRIFMVCVYKDPLAKKIIHGQLQFDAGIVAGSEEEKRVFTNKPVEGLDGRHASLCNSMRELYRDIDTAEVTATEFVTASQLLDLAEYASAVTSIFKESNADDVQTAIQQVIDTTGPIDIPQTRAQVAAKAAAVDKAAGKAAVAKATSDKAGVVGQTVKGSYLPQLASKCILFTCVVSRQEK